MDKNLIQKAIRSIERDMNNCPEIDCDDLYRYPYLDEDLFALMESEYSNDTSYIYIYPYCRNADNPYIDIYVWDCTLLSRPWTRFVIQNGYRLERQQETLFVEYARSSIKCINEDIFNDLYERVTEIFPAYNYNKYEIEDAGMAFLHLYYVSHRSGHLEILYKSGLSRLAYNSNIIPDCNYLGSSPEEICGGVPLKLLKILNQPYFQEFYIDKQKLEMSRRVYKEYSGYFNKMPSFSQFYYLYKVRSEDGHSNYLFNRTVYKRLENSSDKHIVDLYIEFLQLCEGNNTKIDVPQSYEELVIINGELKFLGDDYYKNIAKKIRKRKRNTDYDFVGHKFSVFMPANVKEMGIEALEQNNCLAEYIEAHSKEYTTILFLRRTKASQKSFVTVEIDGDRIEQIQGKNNIPPDPEVYLFMESYCAYKSIDYSPLALIMEGRMDHDKNISENLCRYLYYYLSRRRKCGFEKVEKETDQKEHKTDDGQISLFDMFPECMIIEEEVDELDEDEADYELLGDEKYVPVGELECFIWNNLDSIFNEQNESYNSSHDKLMDMIQSLEVNEHSFNDLWHIFEAYNIPEIKYALLNYYDDFLTENEVELIKTFFPAERYNEIARCWRKSIS